MKTTPVVYLPALDLLRGIAVLGVCFCHATGAVPTFLAPDSVLKNLGASSHYVVAAFFVISGFAIPYSLFHRDYQIRHFGHFLLKRALRIEPPYLATISFMLGLNYISSLMPWYNGQAYVVNWVQVALHPGYLAAFFDYPWINSGFWTLAIEFQYYLFIGCLFPLLVCERSWVRYATLAGFCGLGVLIPSSNFVFCYSGLFTIGILFFQYKSQLMGKAGLMISTLSVLGGIYFHHNLPIVLVALLSALTILFVRRVPRICVFFANISYSLYLLHSPIGERVLNLGAKFVHDPMLRNGLVLLSMIISVAIAWLFCRLVEVPALRLSRKIDYKQYQTGKKEKGKNRWPEELEIKN